MKLLRKLRNIIIGNINNLFGLNKEISNNRMLICDKCEHEIILFKIGKTCNNCGCILKAKTTVENEHCKLNKW